MRIDLPYSLYVRDRDVLWSCGQCPLNGSGDVLHPDDLFAQAHAVANLIHQFLQSIGSDRSSLAQLAVYYVKTADGDSDRLRKFFRETFNPNMIVIPISIPHFYYDGMMIEVDVFGSRTSKKFSRVVDKATAAELEVADVGELRFASLTAPPGINFDGVPGRLFEQSGLAMEQLLSAQWLVASASGYKQLESSKANETTNSWQVASIIPDGFEIVGQLIFGPRRATVPEVRTKLLTYEEESVQIRRSESCTYFDILGVCLDGIGHVEQTMKIMRRSPRRLKIEDCPLPMFAKPPPSMSQEARPRSFTTT
jgi:enamine deaminase RidA (YjgF/YER057c/UK114 family)